MKNKEERKDDVKVDEGEEQKARDSKTKLKRITGSLTL